MLFRSREIPLYWKFLTHKGGSNLTEEKSVIRPVIRLLKSQKIMMTADREFHSIFLSHWLKKYQKQDVYFVFRQKKSTKANETRLNNLILLIAISYTISSFQVQKLKNKGVQEDISITNEKSRKERRNCSFFVGLSMIYWAINDDFHAKN